MKYFESNTKYTTEIDENGFVAPYYCVTPQEEEILKDKYFQLSNQSKNPFHTRCNGIIYGGEELRNNY